MDRLDDWALNAFVDNEVTGEQRAEIEALLRADPAAAHKADAWQRQRDLLHRAYDGVLAEPVPPALAAALRGGGRQPVVQPWLAMAAALALVLLGGLSGWLMRAEEGTSAVAEIARDAIAAHEVYSVEVRHPVEVGADDREHLQAWLSKRVGTQIRLPDLQAEGYALLGGRLLTAGDKPAAMLMYEDRARNRVTLVLTSEPAAEETALHVEHKGKLIACYWRSEHVAFAVAGEMLEGPMMKLAKEIYDQFET